MVALHCVLPRRMQEMRVREPMMVRAVLTTLRAPGRRMLSTAEVVRMDLEIVELARQV